DHPHVLGALYRAVGLAIIVIDQMQLGRSVKPTRPNLTEGRQGTCRGSARQYTFAVFICSEEILNRVGPAQRTLGVKGGRGSEERLSDAQPNRVGPSRHEPV